MQTLGERIREIRLSRGLLLREVAAALKIDPSLLSRLENGEKRMTREQVVALASILKVPAEPLMIHYLSEQIVYALIDEDLAIKAIGVAEKRINYIRLSGRLSGKLSGKKGRK